PYPNDCRKAFMSIQALQQTAGALRFPEVHALAAPAAAELGRSAVEYETLHCTNEGRRTGHCCRSAVFRMLRRDPATDFLGPRRSRFGLALVHGWPLYCSHFRHFGTRAAFYRWFNRIRVLVYSPGCGASNSTVDSYCVAVGYRFCIVV